MGQAILGQVFHLLQILAIGHTVPEPELVYIVNPFSLLPKTFFPIIVSIHGTALWSLWKTYLGIVFEGKQFDPVSLFKLFVSLLSSPIRLLFHLAVKKKQVAQFAKLWCRSNCIIIQQGRLHVDFSL